MSHRIVIIDTCEDCPHFDNQYWGFHETCKKLNRTIPSPYDIPEDCPLDKVGGSDD